MARFITKLHLRADGEQWVVDRPFGYMSDILGEIKVPAGFKTDLASVPRLPLIYLVAGGTGNEPAVIHDHLYSTKKCTRAQADAVFREACEVVGMPAWRRWMMWAGLRVGGWAHW